MTSYQLNRLIVYNCTIGLDNSSIHLMNGLQEGMFDFATCTENYLIEDTYSA